MAEQLTRNEKVGGSTPPCGSKSKRKVYMLESRVCACCYESFETKIHNKKYCSKECKNKFRYKHKTCKFCKKKYMPKPGQYWYRDGFRYVRGQTCYSEECSNHRQAEQAELAKRKIVKKGNQLRKRRMIRRQIKQASSSAVLKSPPPISSLKAKQCKIT